MMSSISFAFAIVVVLAECISQNGLALGVPPAAILYSEKGGKGRTLKSLAENHPDLSRVSFDDLAQTACIRGTWIFYDAKSYSEPDSIIGYRFSKGERSFCFNFDQLGGKVSSFRYVGSSEDVTADSLDLYNGVHFTDEHLSTDNSIVDLRRTNIQEPQSLIVSGKTVWTLYEEPYYRGNYVCLSSNTEQNSPRFFPTTSDIRLSTIGSIRKGCLSTVLNQI